MAQRGCVHTKESLVLTALPTSSFDQLKTVASTHKITSTRNATQGDRGNCGIERIDFENMSYDQVIDTVNELWFSGALTEEEFFGLRLSSAPYGDPYAVPYNPIEDARLGIDGALSRSSSDEARQCQFTLDTLLRVNGRPHHVDLRA